MPRRYGNGLMGDAFVSLVSPVWWVWTFLAFRLIMGPRGTQLCFRFCSRMPRRYGNGLMGDTFVSLVSPVWWVWTF